MFIQIIQGKCTRPDELRSLLQTWHRDLSAGATGWLGATYGFADDDMFLGVVRFESREAAMANSERPEQGEWAKELLSVMDGQVEFHDCDDVTLMLDGGSNSAGFVQVIRGRVADPSGLKALMADADMLHEVRPEIIGATLGLEEDGTFTETVAFTDEAAAREGEKKEIPAQAAESLRQWNEMIHDVQFLDLHEPWFATKL